MDMKNVTHMIYNACQLIEIAKEQIEENREESKGYFTYDQEEAIEEEQEFLTDLYDDLFELTTRIEIFYGII